MKRIRVEKAKPPRRREWGYPPLDPRDPDVVRAHGLRRLAEMRRNREV